MKWSVGAKIGAGYALALVILIALGITSYRNTASLIQSLQMKAHTYQVLENIEKLLSTLNDAESDQRGYVITGDDVYLASYRDASASIGEIAGKLKGLTADNPNQQRRLDAMGPKITAKLAVLNETIELRKGQGFDAAVNAVQQDKGRLLMEDITKIASDMEDEERALLAERENNVKRNTALTIGLIAYGIPMASLLILLVGWWVTRTITHQLRESVAQLSASSSEILATTTQVASGAAETATAVSETTATVEEVKQTAQLTSQKARYVSDSAQKVAQVSQLGRKSVEDVVAGMHRIQEQMESIAESVMRLSEQGQAIGEIIATVNDLAEQSNVLAVNAAIEASKAGEQGRGFGVVAQEIKSLAEQSKQATAQVRSILGDIQKATTAAVLAAEQGHKAVESGLDQSSGAGDSIRQLSESVTEAAQAAMQIAASSQQQMVGMDQVAQAMDSIKQASAQNVAGTKQAEVAAQGLHELGYKLGLLIGYKTA